MSLSGMHLGLTDERRRRMSFSLTGVSTANTTTPRILAQTSNNLNVFGADQLLPHPRVVFMQR
jgi:hypothetical protein